MLVMSLLPPVEDEGQGEEAFNSKRNHSLGTESKEIP